MSSVPKINPFSTIPRSLAYQSKRVEYRKSVLEEDTRHREEILQLPRGHDCYVYLKTYKDHVQKGLSALDSASDQIKLYAKSAKKSELSVKIDQLYQAYQQADRNDDSALLATVDTSTFGGFIPSKKEVFAKISLNLAKVTEYQRIIQQFPLTATIYQQWFKDRLSQLETFVENPKDVWSTYLDADEILNMKDTLSDLRGKITTTQKLFECELSENRVRSCFQPYRTTREKSLHSQFNQFSTVLRQSLGNIYIPGISEMLTSCDQEIVFSSALYQGREKQTMTLTQRFYYHLYLTLCQDDHEAIPANDPDFIRKADPDFIRKAFHNQGGYSCNKDQVNRAIARTCVELTLEVLQKYVSSETLFNLNRESYYEILEDVANVLDDFDITIEGNKIGYCFNKILISNKWHKTNLSSKTVQHNPLTDYLFVSALKSWGYI